MSKDDIQALRLGILVNFPKQCGEERTKEAVRTLNVLESENKQLQTQNHELTDMLKGIKEDFEENEFFNSMYVEICQLLKEVE